ncbi:hypothetical protein CC78DRAFT_616815 [Lojkania enalia]|uniref:Uncharacterized protein n=1 Tax=Lojkania enalia TaxID=147567 RepID=A0A9P4K948_9PLEO|nr:hypothetical protein CC78DRAFT_616815 [Didymosphaeria enalia]
MGIPVAQFCWTSMRRCIKPLKTWSIQDHLTDISPIIRILSFLPKSGTTIAMEDETVSPTAAGACALAEVGRVLSQLASALAGGSYSYPSTPKGLRLSIKNSARALLGSTSTFLAYQKRKGTRCRPRVLMDATCRVASCEVRGGMVFHTRLVSRSWGITFASATERANWYSSISAMFSPVLSISSFAFAALPSHYFSEWRWALTKGHIQKGPTFNEKNEQGEAGLCLRTPRQFPSTQTGVFTETTTMQLRSPLLLLVTVFLAVQNLASNALALPWPISPRQASLYQLSPHRFDQQSPPTHHHHKRGLPGAVYICTDKRFSGNCAWQPPSSDCRIVGTGDLAPESIGPDPGGFCALYSSQECSESLIQTLRFPGLASGVPEFGSLRCWADETDETISGLTAMGQGDVDARLAGGVGSARRKEVESAVEEMQKDGFREGMIGLNKKEYY